jgi:hypothetical protein
MKIPDITKPEIITYRENNNFSHLVEHLKSKYLSLWWEVEEVFPSFEIQYSKNEKLYKEKETDKFIEELNKRIEYAIKEKDEKKINKDEIITLLKTNLNNIFGITEDNFGILFNKGFPEVTNNFVKEARKFNPSINIYDIYQAMRNVWIINTIQMLIDEPVSLSPSIFAYSLLYPYTDNYLDEPQLSRINKSEFNKRFKKRLAFENVLPFNNHEEEIFKLVSMIEGQFSRVEFPFVYESLLAIHNAQEKSLIQQNENSSPYEKDILGISFEKGGTSVLVDGYLIKGCITYDEADFLYGFGVFLQLIDDLSDIDENTKSKQMTIFSQTAKRWPLDKLVNRLYWFMIKTLDSSNCFCTDSFKLKKIIESSCIFLIIDSISKYKKMFSREYIKEINKYSVFRFPYRKKFKKKVKNLFIERYEKNNKI